ncbi:sensor histidine kinase [Mucilaginibacter rubeus]|uniref:histidine kinase n=1 Tax=Mucilaginibacter rubeus TaxID=2027860 RepID=A0A5C1I8L1_9SPHI|nr:sensor histidine kinase [Mucilaginibacter rubeus]QEM14253.1 sensor histidine kinase [Mucilaginibacter rubeus]
MKKYWLFLLLFNLANSSLAQTSDLDELPLPILRQKLAASTDDTNTVKVQLALGHLMLLKATSGKSDVDSAIQFSVQAANLSRQLKYDFGIINAMLLRAETYYRRNDWETGLKIAENALAFAQMHQNGNGEARSYHLIAQYYRSNDSASLRSRIFYLNKAIAIFRKNRNNLWLSFLLTQNADLLFQAERATEALKLLFEALNLGKGISRRTVEGIYWNIGRISLGLGDYTNALKYNLLALKTAYEVKDTSLQASFIKNLIATTYIKMQDYERAVPYSTDVVTMGKRYHSTYFFNTGSSALAFEYTHMNQLPKALAILDEVKARAESDLDKLSVKLDFLNNLVYAKQLVQAGKYAKRVNQQLLKISSDHVTEIMNAYNALAYYYSETGQLKKAYGYLELYGAMAQRLNYIEGIDLAENQYYKVVALNQGPNTAIGHFIKDQEIRDSADNKVKAYQIFLLDMENETLEKNRHIDSLTMDTQIKNSKIQRNQLIQRVTICGFLMLLIMTGLIYSRYRLKQRSNALLTLQKDEIDQKNHTLQQLVMDKNDLLKDKDDLLKDKDELLSEKELLLKEVNHRVKNNLHSVLALLENQAALLQGEAFEVINKSRHRIYAMSLIHEKLLETSELKFVNMSAYLPQLIVHIRDCFHGAGRIKFNIHIEPLILDVSLALPLALIVNEAVTNALKYAFADGGNGEVTVALAMVKDNIRLEITDNGIGIARSDKSIRGGGIGIRLMRGLCEDIDARIRFENVNGTRITVTTYGASPHENINLDKALSHLPDLAV